MYFPRVLLKETIYGTDMAYSLMTKFNELTTGEFDYLVLESVDVEIGSESVRVNMIFPEAKESVVRSQTDRITEAVTRALGSKASVFVKLTKSHFDADFFRAKLISFLNGYPSLAPYVFADNIIVKQNAEYDFSVILKVDSDIYDYALKRGLVEDVKKMLAVSYCEAVSFTIEQYETSKKEDYIQLAEDELKNYVYQTSGGHFIIPQNVEEFVGKIIYDRAGYISDANREISGAVYCGTVSNFSECQRKPREGEAESKKFYKFTITDPTGSLKCLYFPLKKDGECNIINLKDGKDVVVKGSLKENRFRGQVTYDMFVNSLSLCTLPENLEIDKNEYRAAGEYKCIAPEKYIEAKQATIFDVIKPPSKWLIGKTFCVFDVETTGIDTNTCKIIELAAVKVVDGAITETFSTFINPKEHISERITELTSITDADVAQAPTIDKVLPDFYKFSENTVLVGHNVNFDIGFINASGKAMGIYFNNAREDTLELAQRYLKGLRNYKLGTVIKHLGIVNDQAHRAIYDTIATAKAFIKIADYMG